MRQRKVPAADESAWLQPKAAEVAAPAADDQDENKPMSLADEIRARTAGRHFSSDSSSGGLLGPSSPYSIFSRVDYVIFFLLFVALYFAVKIEYKIDLLDILWSQYLRPNYDEDDDNAGGF